MSEILNILRARRPAAPTTREVLVDLDTPLSVYLKLAAAPRSFLLESVEGGERWGRHSIIGLPSRYLISYADGRMHLHDGDEQIASEAVDDPLSLIREVQQVWATERTDPGVFGGGLVGYFGYETVATIEPRLAGAADAPASDRDRTPDIALMLCTEVAVLDNLTGHLHLITHAVDGEARLDALQERLRGDVSGAGGFPTDPVAARFEAGFQQQDYLAAVGRIQAYIRDGDAMQVVLSQRLSAPFSGRALDLYRALRFSNPSPYLYFLDLGDHQVAGSSPETLVRCRGEEVRLRPIAGTRPRGRDADEDAALEAELCADEKERAEHLMLVDLGRNDVGRVAETGSVRVAPYMTVERYSRVMHLVSEVAGRRRPDLDTVDVLRACFPAGTVSGAPKVRAMEIIHELEPVRRGIYAGAIGYIGWDGDMDTAIAIRTAVVRDGRVHVQAGAGIVADSDPQREWEETMHKASAVCRATDMASIG